MAIENAVPLLIGEAIVVPLGGYVVSNYISGQPSWGAFSIGAVVGAVMVPAVGYFGNKAYTSYKLAKASIDKEHVRHGLCESKSPAEAYNFFVAMTGRDSPSTRELMSTTSDETIEVMNSWKRDARCG